MSPATAAHFQLCYRSYVDREAGFAFPCDECGHVDLDSLSDRTRNDYLYARAMVGKELDPPLVECTRLH